MKPRSTLAVATALAATIALAACGSSDEATAPGTDATETGALVAADPAAAAALPTIAQGFVDMASASDLFEVEAGKLAQANGKSQAVKDFGKMMEADHTKSTAELKTAAAEAEDVTVNPRLDPKQQADLDALRGAGDKFDAVYKQQQVAAHTQALALLRNYAAGGDEMALRSFAGTTATVVEGHLDDAESLP